MSAWCPVLVVPVPPAGNRYWRNVRGRMVKSREARVYLEGLWQLGSRWRQWKVDAGGDVEVAVAWQRTRNQGDLDNRLKILFDGLNGIGWVDDKQIKAVAATVVAGDADVMSVSWRPQSADGASVVDYLRQRTPVFPELAATLPSPAAGSRAAATGGTPVSL